DSPKGAAWLESIGSFRYEPTGDGKAYTVRKEGKSGEYWYGCRKVAGKVRKKYIGKSSEVSIAKLEEIAEALEVPTEPRVKQVAEVLQVVEVAEGVAQDRLTALEVQVAELLKAVKCLQEALPGKSESGDSLKLPKIDNEVVERLQNELGNLKAENEKLQADYAALLKSSTDVTNKLREEVRSQLATERADREEVERQLSDRETEIVELRSELSNRETEPAPASDLFGKVSELASLFKTLLPKKTKLPAGAISEIEKILKGS
ncbi:hypothetical protein, partial [Microcoleus sp. BROC3]|uniref:hypothetical protein n=1 Tax=Microcoleus sp. BROC3 TaxID=3055323 RepID=UPI002FD21E7C